MDVPQRMKHDDGLAMYAEVERRLLDSLYRLLIPGRIQRKGAFRRLLAHDATLARQNANRTKTEAQLLQASSGCPRGRSIVVLPALTDSKAVLRIMKQRTTNAKRKDCSLMETS